MGVTACFVIEPDIGVNTDSPIVLKISSTSLNFGSRYFVYRKHGFYH